METRLVNKLAAKGFNVTPKTVQITPEVEYDFSWTSYSIVKDLASTVSKTDKSLNLPEFFVKNYKRHFKTAKTIEDDVSKYISVMALHNLGKEIAMYRYMFTNEVNQKICRVFIDFFNQLQKIHPNLYQNKLKLLRSVKLELRVALEIGSIILRNDNAISTFTNLLSTHMEASKVAFHSLTSETVAMILVEAYILTYNLRQSDKDEEGVFLNWDEFDGQTFTIEVNANRKEVEEQYSDNNDEMEDTGVSIEKLNAEYRKAIKHNDHVTVKKPVDSELNDQVIRICHRYVFNENPESQDEEVGEIDTQLVSLNAKLAKTNAEFELQQNIWKLILNASKGAVKGYRGLKSEIQNVEGLTDALMGLLDKNTDEWRRCFVIKNNTVDKLKRYKFLVAAILESCGTDLKKDLNDFRFAHDEDSRNMRSIFDQKQDFDLYEYLTTVYQPPKPQITVSGFKEPKAKQTKVVENDNRDRLNSLAGKLERFEVKKGSTFDKPKLPSKLEPIDEDFLDQPFDPEMIEGRESFDVSDSFVRHDENEKRVKIQAMKEGLAKIKIGDKNPNNTSNSSNKLKQDISARSLTPNKNPRNNQPKSARRNDKKDDLNGFQPDEDGTFWSKVNSCSFKERARGC